MNYCQNAFQKLVNYNRYIFYIISALLCLPAVYAEAPEWSVDVEEYSSSLSLVSEFYLNEEVFDSQNIVGAFVGEQCRGVSTVAAYGDGYVYLITIYGNTAGETVTFKAWIAEEDAVVDVEESVTFAPGVMGALSSPEQFNAFQNFDFAPSLTGIPDQKVHMGDNFATITLSDYLIVEDSDDLLWTTSTATNFTISLSEDVITLTPQDNWVGSETIIFTVTELTENGYSDSDTAIFTQLRPDNPPIISGIPDRVIGPNGTFPSFDLDDYITEIDDDVLTYDYSYGQLEDTYEDPDWSVNSSDFEFSMSMVVRVKARGVFIEGSSHYVAALDESGEVRGVAQADAYLDEWRYLLTIYSEQEGDRISFRFYDATNSLNIPIDDTISFVNNSVIGTTAIPYDLVANFLDVELDQNGLVSISRVEQSWVGSESIVFSIIDNGTQNSYSSSDEVLYTVESDYEPILSGIPDQSIGPDGSFSIISLNDYLETFDDDNILWSVSGNIDLNVSLDGSNVTITHDNDYIGSETLIFTATDDTETGLSSSDTASYSVVAYDNIPLLFNVPDQAIAIGGTFDTLDLSQYLAEVDGDDVMWSYEFLDYPSNVPTPDWEAPLSGTFTMGVVSTVKALGVTTQGSDHILIAVDENYDILGLSNAVNVNDIWIYNMTLYSDENNIDYKFLFYDNSSQRILPVDVELEFVAGNVVGSASEPIELKAGRVFISVNGQGKVSFDILTTNWDLAETIRFTVTDAFTDENKSSYNDISVMIDNDLPVLSISSWSAQEGSSFEPFQLNSYISDNGTPFDSLLINFSTGPNYTAEVIDDVLNVYPPVDPDWHGSEMVSFEITDAHPYNVKTLTASVEFIITPVNDAPIIAEKSDEVIEEDIPTTFTMELTDIDTGEVLTLSASSSVSDLTVTTNSDDSTITVTPAADWYGESEIVVIVSDGELTDTTSFILTVSPVNDAPRVAEVIDQAISEDNTLVVSLEVVNVDTGETLTTFVSSSSDQVSVTANSSDLTIKAVPAQDWYGQTEIDVIVSDGQFAQAISFALNVIPVNDAPVIEQIDDLFANENIPLIVDLNFYDVDSELLTVTSFSDRDEVTTTASISSSSIEIFTSDFHGQSEIAVVVSDGELSDTTNFNVTIAPTNDAPIILPIEDQVIDENSIGVFAFELTDIDTGEVLTLFAYSDTLDVLVTANSNDSTITVTPIEDWHGFSVITVIVFDGELADTTQFSVAVGPINDAPIILSIEDQLIEEDSIGVFAFEVLDIDTGTVLTLSAFSDTSSVQVVADSEEYTVALTPNQDWHGQAEIMVIVSDNFLMDTTSFVATFSPINDAPIITPVQDISIEENEQYILQLELTDVDTGEVLALSVSSSVNDLAVSANSNDSTVTLTPASDWYGESDVVVVVSDGELNDTTNFMVTIDPINDSPGLSEISDQTMLEDDTLTIFLEVVNVDTGETLTAFVSSSLSQVSVTANSSDLTIKAVPDRDWHGQTEISVIVSDGELASSVSFVLTVDPVNDAPFIAQASDISFPEDSSFSSIFQYADIDTGEVLVFSAFSDTNQVMVTASSIDSSILIVPEPNWNGTSMITLVVADQELSDTTTFTITVTNTPDIPFAVLEGDMKAIQNQNIIVDGSGSYDIDDDDLSYFWTIIPEDSTFALEGIIGDTVATELAFLEFLTSIRSKQHDYLIKLWVENSNGLRSEPDSLMLTVQNFEANDILPDLSDVINKVGDPVSIQVEIPESFIADSISLTYSDIYTGFTTSSMIEQSSNSSTSSFLYEIPFYMINLEGLVYYVYVSDPFGNEIITDTTDVLLSFNEGVVSSGMNYGEFAQGFPKESWRMVSVPSYLDRNSLENIFYSVLGTTSESSWMIYTWNHSESSGESNTNIGWGQPVSIEPGKAYWLKQIVVDDGYFAASSGKTVELTGYDISVNPGWNMISSPYIFPVSVDIDKGVFSDLHMYGDGDLEGWVDTVVTVMSPWAGYAIYNHASSEKKISLKPLSSRNSRQLARSSDETKWSLKIGVQSGNYFDNKNIYGVAANATDQLDNLDTPEPPIFDNYVSLYSVLENFDGKKQKVTKDYRGESDRLQVWDLVLDSEVDQEIATMKLNITGDMGNNVLWFIDMQNGDSYDLHQTGFLTLSIGLGSDQFSNKYKLIYGDEDEAASLVKDIVALIPKEFSLGHNYPNPFNPSTTIPFTITEPGLAVVTIYDISGREIRQILNESLRSGFYSTIWDGKNSNGVPVSSGVYYYGLKTKTFNSFKKMILIK